MQIAAADPRYTVIRKFDTCFRNSSCSERDNTCRNVDTELAKAPVTFKIIGDIIDHGPMAINTSRRAKYPRQRRNSIADVAPTDQRVTTPSAV